MSRFLAVVILALGVGWVPARSAVAASLTDQPPIASEPAVAPAGGALSFRPGADGRSVELHNPAGATLVRRCKVNAKVMYARSSFDGLSIIISSDSYLPKQSLVTCGEQPLPARKTPEESGMLQDVNLKRGLYIAVLPVSTQPMSFLAVVAKLGSAKNLVKLPGAYVDRQSERQRLRMAFAYSEDVGERAKISVDGRYVSVSGEFDCSQDAYPGVWDLLYQRKVVLKGDSGERAFACKDLFWQPAPR